MTIYVYLPIKCLPNSLTWCNKGHDTDDRVAYCEDRPEDCDRLTVADIIRCIHVGRVHVLDFRSHFSNESVALLSYFSTPLSQFAIL